MIEIIEIHFRDLHCQTAKVPYEDTAKFECPLGNEYPVAVVLESPAGRTRASRIQGL